MSDRDHLTYSREVMTRKYAETYAEESRTEAAGSVVERSGTAHSATISGSSGWI